MPTVVPTAATPGPGEKESFVKKRVGTIALASAVGLGGLATGVVVAPALANAATSESPAPSASSPAQPPAPPAPPSPQDRAARIKDALSGLVSDGTITQAQADKVASTLADKLPAGRGHGFGGPGGPGGPGGHGPGGARLDAAAKALGVSPEDLRTALRDGKSLADVA